MKKEHYDGAESGSGAQIPEMLKTFSTLMGSLPKSEPRAPDVPENYNNKKFEKLIREHDRISREIDRKYNNGRPRP